VQLAGAADESVGRRTSTRWTTRPEDIRVADSVVVVVVVVGGSDADADAVGSSSGAAGDRNRIVGVVSPDACETVGSAYHVG